MGQRFGRPRALEHEERRVQISVSDDRHIQSVRLGQTSKNKVCKGNGQGYEIDLREGSETSSSEDPRGQGIQQQCSIDVPE